MSDSTTDNATCPIDSFARTINYLRVSLTDQCNLRCQYCTPRPLLDKLPGRELLSYEELLAVLRVAVELGVRKVRLTGGEPLLRRGVEYFIGELLRLPGLTDVRITTNGTMLAEKAAPLYASGIRKVNISLDTLRPERFLEITGLPLFERVWRGVEEVLALGFEQVKLNVVVLRGVNDDELADFADLSRRLPLQIRFIEYMPIGSDSSWHQDRYLPASKIKERLQALGELVPQPSGSLDGPARVFKLAGSVGSLGLISPISEHFCARCNRLRLTSQGRLRSCLLSDRETDLKAIVRGGGGVAEIRAALLATIRDKPAHHRLAEGETLNCHGRMSRIGG